MFQLIYFLIFFFTCTIQVLSQSKNISGSATYISTLRTSLYVEGSGNRVDTTTLYFNDTSSLYIIIQKNTIDEKKILQSVKDMPPSAQQQLIDGFRAIGALLTKNYQYHKGSTDVISSLWYDPTLKPYCILDTIPEFSWELLPDTTRLLGFLCQKAVCKSAVLGEGMREFIAWYTPDLPVSYGPFRFFGLPGLILEIDTKYNNYKAIAVKLPLQPEEQIIINCCGGLPFISRKQADLISKKQYLDMMDMRKLRNN